MAHINYARTTHGPAVSDAWLPATAQATQFAGRLAGREEIAVKLGPGFAKAAGTAMFNPALLEIEVDTDVMLPGVKPEDVVPTDDLFRARQPLFVGALAHEAFHARYSRWVPANLMIDCPVEFTQRKIDVLITLEESRIEARGLRRYPALREAMGSIALDLLGKDFKVADNAYGASIAAALMLARVDARSISEAEAKPFRDIIGTVLDDETLDALRELWLEYHALPFNADEDLPLEAMDSIATRWIEALGMDASDEGAEDIACTFGIPSPDGEGEGEAGESASSTGTGSGSGSGKESESGEGEGGSGEGEGDMEKALKEAAKNAAHDKGMKAAEKVGDIKAKRRQAQRDADKVRRDKGKKAADEAFGKPAEPRNGKKTGYANTGGSSIRWRKPTDRERAAGVRLSRLLEKVIYTDKRIAKVRQVMPGGRLHGRGQVQRAAARRAGQQPDAAGWVVKKRTTVDEPRMKVGVMLDVSGSMSAQARLAGSLAYAMGNAVERAGGEFAMTTFGKEALGVIKPGDKIDMALDIGAHCGWENFQAGFYSLENMLDLIDGDGLRVLILLSDGIFVQGAEAKAADAILPLLAAKGVVVIHVDIDGDVVSPHYAHYNPRHNNPYEPVYVSREMDPVEAVSLLGEHLIASVKKFKGLAA